MKLPKLLLFALATSAMSLCAQTLTIDLPSTGAGGIGGIDPNWSVYKFSNLSGLGRVTGSAGLTSYLGALNSSTLSAVATARDATRFSSAWVLPSEVGATWLSIETNQAGQAIHDSTGGGGYAFVFDLGGALGSVGTDFSQSVAFSFLLNGDNGFSAHLTSLSGNQYVAGAQVLGSTAQNFGSAVGANVSFSGLVSQDTELVILLSNDFQDSGNPGGILVQDFTGTYTAIPEPSTYALIFGACTLGLVAWRRSRK